MAYAKLIPFSVVPPQYEACKVAILFCIRPGNVPDEANTRVDDYIIIKMLNFEPKMSRKSHLHANKAMRSGGFVIHRKL